MNPMAVLRDYTIRGELDKIQRVGKDELRFSTQYTFPCNLIPPYRSKSGTSYTLETLVFFAKHRHAKPSEYIKLATNHHSSVVTFVDRKPLSDYLEGRSASSDAVDEYRPDDPQFSVPPSTDVNLNDAAHDDASAAAMSNWEDDSAAAKVSGGEGNLAEEDVMALISAIERPLRDRNSILQCRNRDFFSIYVGAMKREEEKKRDAPQRKESGGGGGGGMSGAKGRTIEREESGVKAKMLKGGGKVGEGVPIILVPSASNTLITIYNVKEFLEDGVFIPTDVKMKQMKGPKPECVTVQKKFSRDKDKVMAAYEVRDKPSSLKRDDWDRVVAVFVLGKEWQFKDWPDKDHVDIFNKVIGFFMRFEDDSIESAKVVKQWNVKIISISKNKRHQDRAAALEVWSKLEEFVARSRS